MLLCKICVFLFLVTCSILLYVRASVCCHARCVYVRVRERVREMGEGKKIYIGRWTGGQLTCVISLYKSILASSCPAQVFRRWPCRPQSRPSLSCPAGGYVLVSPSPPLAHPPPRASLFLNMTVASKILTVLLQQPHPETCQHIQGRAQDAKGRQLVRCGLCA